jgi:hypothetical protein
MCSEQPFEFFPLPGANTFRNGAGKPPMSATSWLLFKNSHPAQELRLAARADHPYASEVPYCLSTQLTLL